MSILSCVQRFFSKLKLLETSLHTQLKQMDFKSLVTIRINEIFLCHPCWGQKLNFYVWKSRQR